jgi:hypothetical protein
MAHLWWFCLETFTSCVMLLQIFEERDSFYFITVKIADEIEQV